MAISTASPQALLSRTENEANPVTIMPVKSSLQYDPAFTTPSPPLPPQPLTTVVAFKAAQSSTLNSAKTGMTFTSTAHASSVSASPSRTSSPVNLASQELSPPPSIRDQELFDMDPNDPANLAAASMGSFTFQEQNGSTLAHHQQQIHSAQKNTVSPGVTGRESSVSHPSCHPMERARLPQGHVELSPSVVNRLSTSHHSDTMSSQRSSPSNPAVTSLSPVESVTSPASHTSGNAVGRFLKGCRSSLTSHSAHSKVSSVAHTTAPLPNEQVNLIVVPTIYVFIFINPNSGLRQGKLLLDLDISHYRLRSRPNVQVSLINMADPDDRRRGFEYYRLIQNQQALSSGINVEQLHVWSAGGDGTFVWCIDEMVKFGLSFDDPRLRFCMIPFGTGNDLSQVLGWGRTVNGNPTGYHLHKLDELIRQRLDGQEARLDLWEVEVDTFDDGEIVKASKQQKPGVRRLTQRMSNYASLGVQGFVGIGFEPNRHASRSANILEYTRQSAKVVYRGIPKVTDYIDRVEFGGEEVPAEAFFGVTQKSCGRKRHKAPVEIIVQNIPGMWGRHVDIWGNAKMQSGASRIQTGPMKMENWLPNRACDGRLEVFSIASLASYFKKQLGPWARRHLTRLGQFPQELTIHFRPQSETALMIDGEFYRLHNARSVTWRMMLQVAVMGPSEEQSRLVRDTVSMALEQGSPLPAPGIVGNDALPADLVGKEAGVADTHTVSSSSHHSIAAASPADVLPAQPSDVGATAAVLDLASGARPMAA